MIVAFLLAYPIRQLNLCLNWCGLSFLWLQTVLGQWPARWKFKTSTITTVEFKYVTIPNFPYCTTQATSREWKEPPEVHQILPWRTWSSSRRTLWGEAVCWTKALRSSVIIANIWGLPVIGRFFCIIWLHLHHPSFANSFLF